MKNIILVGAGRMGGALLRGWIEALGSGFHFIAVDQNAGPWLADILRAVENGARFSHVERADQLPENMIADVIQCVGGLNTAHFRCGIGTQ